MQSKILNAFISFVTVLSVMTYSAVNLDIIVKADAKNYKDKNSIE